LELLEDRMLPDRFTAIPGAPDGAAGSLRADVIAANNNGQDNVIDLQAGLYQLTIPNVNGHEVGAATGDLGITSAGHTLTIEGVDANTTFIDANSLDRAFQVLPGVTLILKNLTVTGGHARDDGSAGAKPYTTDSLGGAILNSGSLTLENVRLENNVADGFIPALTAMKGHNSEGGAIYTDGPLTVINSVITNNSAVGQRGGDGFPAVPNGNPGADGGPPRAAASSSTAARSASSTPPSPRTMPTVVPGGMAVPGPITWWPAIREARAALAATPWGAPSPSWAAPSP
jgi:hypothetical protein